MILEKHLLITESDLSVVATLKQQVDLSSIQIKQAIAMGCLWLQKGHKIKRLRRLKTQLKLEQQLHFYYNSEILSQRPLEAKLIEDNDGYSVWFKPRGMLCQGSKWGDHTTIYRFVEKNLQPERQAIIVHRLDKMTSGLIILAHQKKLAGAFTQIFEQRKIKKSYQAIVTGIFDQEVLIIDTNVSDKSAVSRVKLINKDTNLNQSLLRITIETGRKHQIRQHLASVGFPILGDRLYGDEILNESEIPDLQLTAYQLEFNCPLSGEIKSYELDDDLCPKFKN